MPLLKAIAVSSPATRCVQTASIALAGQGVRTVQPAQKIYDALLQPSSEALVGSVMHRCEATARRAPR